MDNALTTGFLDIPDYWPREWHNVIEHVRDGFRLDIDGIHGFPHWSRVLENGLSLAKQTGANTRVVVAFALFHDCQRENDGYDPDHGRRGAEYAWSIRGEIPSLTDTEFDLFFEAAEYHSDGLLEGDVTVLTCWDADRLDLYRVGIRPNPKRLCTEAARHPDVIEWAIERSISPYISFPSPPSPPTQPAIPASSMASPSSSEAGADQAKIVRIAMCE